MQSVTEEYTCEPLNPSWYALYTKHQHEKSVSRVLSLKGFDTFLPLYTTTRRWKDRTQMVSLPLFPCYVFLKGGLERRLDIMTTPGIFALVSNAGQPATIPAREMNAILAAVESGASIEPHPFLSCGDWVRVTYGPLVGVEGILVRKKSLYRLVVSVQMLGKAAAVEIDSSWVERLKRKSPGDFASDRTMRITRTDIALPMSR